MRNYGITFSSGDLSFAKFHYGLEVFWGIILGDQDLDYGYYHLGIILQFFAHFSFKHLNLFFFNAISNFVPWESSPWNHHFFLYVWKILFPTPLSEKRWGETPPVGFPPPGKQVSVASSWSAWCSRRIGDRELIRTAVDADVARFLVKRSWRGITYQKLVISGS